MTSAYIRQSLPSTTDLPCSDDTPVDNEDQNLLPNLLLLLLTHLWADRLDWFFGVDMAVYHTTGVSHRVPAVPDAFLSLGVERLKNGESRSSYAVWEEQGVVPIFALEIVSQTPGGEYTEKKALYAKLGVLYYVIYNPKRWGRGEHEPFELYKLEAGSYRLQQGEPYWMPEVGLGIGRYQAQFGNLPKEVLTWYDEGGRRHLDEGEQERAQREQAEAVAQQERSQREQAEAVAQQERSQREQAEALVHQLKALLRAQGIDPDDLPQ